MVRRLKVANFADIIISTMVIKSTFKRVRNYV